jgi:hypothetical protein
MFFDSNCVCVDSSSNTWVFCSQVTIGPCGGSNILSMVRKRGDIGA